MSRPAWYSILAVALGARAVLAPLFPLTMSNRHDYRMWVLALGPVVIGMIAALTARIHHRSEHGLQRDILTGTAMAIGVIAIEVCMCVLANARGRVPFTLLCSTLDMTMVVAFVTIRIKSRLKEQ